MGEESYVPNASTLNFALPSGYTLLCIYKNRRGDLYHIFGPIGSSKATTKIISQKLINRGERQFYSYAECLYAEIETATYVGLED